MKLKRKYNKGFTLVELIVVIAIVAILAAVSVVSYMAFINQANISNDTQLVRDLNTILQADEARYGTRDSYYETLQVIEENGYILEKLTPRTNSYHIVYDRAHNRFALLNENFDLVFGDSGSRTYEAKPDQVWHIVQKGEDLRTDFSNYLAKDYGFAEDTVISNLQTGLDVGENLTRLNITYIGKTSHQSVIIRTQGGTLTVNNGLDDVTHIGFLTESTVTDVKKGTYRELGTVGRLYYNDEVGSITIENKDNNKIFCYMNTSNDVHANKEEVTAANATVYTWVDSGAEHASGHGVDTSAGVTPVTLSGNVVDSSTCHNHNKDFEVIRLGNLQYIVCKCCGGFAEFEGDNEEPVAKTEDITEDFNYNPKELNDKYHFYNSYPDGNHWVHEVKNANHFRNILTHISQCSDTTDEGIKVADKDTVYKIINDINFGGKVWDEYYLQNNRLPAFTGKLIADEQVTLSNVHNTVTTSQLLYDGEEADAKLICLFGAAQNAIFENITLDNMTLKNDLGKGASFFVIGCALSDNHRIDIGYIKFNHCIINSNCSINGKSSLAGFVAQGRCYKTMEFKNCINGATIQAKNHAVGGFVGSASVGNGEGAIHSEGQDTILFENCRNDGDVIGEYRVGGFVAYLADSRYVTFKGTNIINANVYATTTSDANKIKNGLFIGDIATGGASFDTSVTSVVKNNIGNNLLVTGLKDLSNNTKEYNQISANIVDKDGNSVDLAKYKDWMKNNPIKSVVLSYEEDTTLTLSEAITGATDIKFTVDVYTVLSTFGGKDYPAKVYGSVVQSHIYFNETYTSMDDLLNEVRRIKYAGYFIPEGATLYDDTLSGALSSIHLLDDSLKANNYTGGLYSDGVHYNGVNSYVVVTNEVNNGLSYDVVTDWRLRIEYTLTAYDADGHMVANGRYYDGYVDDDRINDTTIGAIPALS